MKKFLFIITTISFALGFVSGVKKIFPYSLVKSIHGRLNVTDLTASLEKCFIETKNYLPDTFTVLIGHAYGSPKTSSINDFIAPNVEKFIKDNKKSIKGLIFTGDVFSVPSSTKWQNFIRTTRA